MMMLALSCLINILCLIKNYFLKQGNLGALIFKNLFLCSSDVSIFCSAKVSIKERSITWWQCWFWQLKIYIALSSQIIHSSQILPTKNYGENFYWPCCIIYYCQNTHCDQRCSLHLVYLTHMSLLLLKVKKGWVF